MSKHRILPRLGDIIEEPNHWDWSGVPCRTFEDVYGFIYRVTNKFTGHDYIGQKSVVTAKCDWHRYKTSSKSLVSDIGSRGVDYLDYFEFKVLFTCSDKQSLNLAETSVIILENCIHRDDNYNKSVPGQRFLIANEHTKRVPDKLSVYDRYIPPDTIESEQDSRE